MPKTKIGRKTAILAILSALSTATQAAPELITNGGFEYPGTFSGSYSTYDFLSSPNAITGWTIGYGSVDLINAYWQHAGGTYSLDLSGDGTGVIFQTIATTIGQQYRLSFDLAGNPDDAGVKTAVLNVTAGLVPQVFTFDSTGQSTTSMGWVGKSLDFVATKSDTTIMFVSGNNNPYGPALDNVSVTAVPEPETYAMLISGLRRRRAKQPPETEAGSDQEHRRQGGPEGAETTSQGTHGQGLPSGETAERRAPLHGLLAVVRTASSRW
jgi:choice-of-anchor C domain-containing protein